jgi:hypothetical protein
MYYEFPVGDKVYKLRLTTRGIIDLEKKIGCNPLAIFGKGDVIPTLTVMLAVFHTSLQPYQHGITEAGAYDIFDNWLADGHNIAEFVPVIIEIYKTSGLIKNSEEEEEEKN